MVLLEQVVTMFPREETGDFPRETGEAGNAETKEGKRKRPNIRKPEAGFCFPGRDAGDEVDGGVNFRVKVEEGGKIGLEVGDASQVRSRPGRRCIDG